jgi:two-component system sensor histidine kinase MprB
MTLRKKLALVTGLITLVTVGVLAVSAYLIASHELRSQVDDSLKSRAATIVREIDRALERTDFFGRQRAPLGPTLLQPEFDAVTQVIDAKGAILASLGPAELAVTGADLELAASNLGFAGRFASADVDDKAYRIYTLSLPAGGAIQLGKDITDIEDARAGLRTWLVVIGLIGIAVAAVIGWIVARRTTRPIEQLASSADEIARTQNTSDPITIDASGEVGNLVTSFNTMLGALGRSLAQQKQLVQDASHELRTPLTSLRANAELLERPDLPPDTRREIVNDIRAEVDELTALSSELSALASDQSTTEVASAVRCVRARRKRRDRRGSTQPVRSRCVEPHRQRSEVQPRPHCHRRVRSRIAHRSSRLWPRHCTRGPAVRFRPLLPCGCDTCDAGFGTRSCNCEAVRRHPRRTNPRRCIGHRRCDGGFGTSPDRRLGRSSSPRRF